MSAAWLEQRERGNLAALRLMTWLTLTLGYRFGRALLYPICVYFLLFSPAARRASRDFLSRVHGRKPRAREVFRHFHTFASTLHDRVEMLAGHTARFDVRLHGAEALESLLAGKRGCLLLGSHLGSFEILRVIGESRRRLAVNLVMHEDNARETSRWLRALAPELAERIIAPSRPDTLLRVRECLERGELVAMLGDRTFGAERSVTCDFLGAKALFPAGPILVAALLQVPVATFFCLYRGPRRYEGYFEPLVEQIAPAREARDEAVSRCVVKYAHRLEVHARAAPDNWFNFYDFWKAP
ncbi:MAG: acyl-CoA synthetase [Burkholderiales bacterium]